jgi:hypothetical protein
MITAIVIIAGIILLTAWDSSEPTHTHSKGTAHEQAHR